MRHRFPWQPKLGLPMLGLPMLVLLPLVTACSGGGTPEEQDCERQAINDPRYKELTMIAAGGDNYYLRHQAEFKRVKQEAYLKCMRAKGLAPPGGVEAPRSPY